MLKNIMSYGDENLQRYYRKISTLDHIETAVTELLQSLSNKGWCASLHDSLNPDHPHRMFWENQGVKINLKPHFSMPIPEIKAFWDCVFSSYFTSDIKWEAQISLSKNYKNDRLGDKFCTNLELKYVLSIYPFDRVLAMNEKLGAILSAIKFLTVRVDDLNLKNPGITDFMHQNDGQYLEVSTVEIGNIIEVDKSIGAPYHPTAIVSIKSDGEKKKPNPTPAPALDLSLSPEEAALREKIKAIIVNNPTQNMFAILRKLRSGEYGNTKISTFKVYKTLKALNLDSIPRRLRFHRSR